MKRGPLAEDITRTTLLAELIPEHGYSLAGCRLRASPHSRFYGAGLLVYASDELRLTNTLFMDDAIG